MVSIGFDYVMPISGPNDGEGKIIVGVRTHEDNETCHGPFQLSAKMCRDNMRLALDNCKSGGENGKQGGYVSKDCFYYVVDPNPTENFPKNWPH